MSDEEELFHWTLPIGFAAEFDRFATEDFLARKKIVDEFYARVGDILVKEQLK